MKDKNFLKFIGSSYKLLHNYSKRGRYYHTLKPNDNSPIVVHKETNQLTTVISGTGNVFLNGKEEHVSQGSIIFIEAGMTHEFIATSDELVLFHIHIPDEGRDNDRYIVNGEHYERFK